MKRKEKPIISVIGGASLTFGQKVLKDLVNHPELDGSTIRLMDVNEERMEIMAGIARRLMDRVDHSIIVESTTDRRAALVDADYVIVSVEVSRNELWQQDFSIPVEMGIRQVTGEMAGPGGLFHALRQIPIHLDIARDIEALCPRAIVMVESNPLDKICVAMRRYSKVGTILGLCHGVEVGQNFLAGLLGLGCDDLMTVTAGTNHFAWILDIRLTSTGEDLYPTLREKLAELDPEIQPLYRKMLDIFGYLPNCGDSHIGEYLPYAWEFVGLKGPGFGSNEKRWQELEKISRGESTEGGERDPLRQFMGPRSWVDTLAFPIMKAIQTNKIKRMPAVNMLNQGTIANLPPDYFVETPAVVDSSGVHPIRIGDLPGSLAALCRRNIEVGEVTVEAAVKGDRNLVLQAMLLDPVVDSIKVAERVVDKMLKVQAEYMPQFA